jgi:hypothetical protein
MGKRRGLHAVEAPELSGQPVPERCVDFLQLRQRQFVEAQIVIVDQVLIPVVGRLGKRAIEAEHPIEAPAEAPFIGRRYRLPFHKQVELFQVEFVRPVIERDRGVRMGHGMVGIINCRLRLPSPRGKAGRLEATRQR